MKEINLTTFNKKLALFQEFNQSVNIVELLEDTSTDIIEKTNLNPTQNDNIFIVLCNEILYFIMLDLSIEHCVKNIVTELDIQSEYSNDIKNILNNLPVSTFKQLNKPNKKTIKKINTIPVEKLDEMEQKQNNKFGDDKESRQRNKKLKDLLMKQALFTMQASNIDSKYFYVYDAYQNDDISIPRGIYYSTNSGSPKILTDCFIEVLNVVSTKSDSLNKHFSYKLEITNKYDEKIISTINSHEIKFGKLFEVLEHCNASIPPSSYLEKMLVHAIQQLAHKQNVLRQIEIDTLGYHTSANGELMYVLTNGIETKDNFIPIEQSLFISPSIPPYANGYKGCDLKTMNDKIMDLIFRKLNNDESVQIILLAMLGASCIVNYPIGDYNGSLNFAIEIIGENGHGKTPLINFMLSFFGYDFNYRKASLFNNTNSNGDTIKQRSEQSSKMKFNLFNDYDNKVSPKEIKAFEKIYNERNNINSSIADNAGRGYLSITRENKYVMPLQGGLVRSGNFDYSTVSMMRDNIPVEKRTCTFIWNKEARNNELVSINIENNRIEYYYIGASYRQWIMSQDKVELLNMFEQSKNIAEITVNNYEWNLDNSYKLHCVSFIIGLELFIKFLNEYLPNSFMINWIQDNIPVLIKNRIDRANYIFGGMQTVLKNNMLEDVLTAIQIQFSSGEMYVKDQQDKCFNSGSINIPYCGTEKLGYNNYKHGKVLAGYVVSNNSYIAFDKKELYNQLHKYGKSHNIDFINIKNIIEILSNNNMIAIDDNNKIREFFKINNKSKRLIGISLNAIYPDIENEDDTIIEENINITHIDDKRKNIKSSKQEETKKIINDIINDIQEIDVYSEEDF